jgi:DNA repair protein RadC
MHFISERGELMESHKFVLRDVPNEERPRERMLQFGAQVLSNAELLAILIRTGTVAESAVRLAERLLAESGTLRSLTDMSVDELVKIKGIGTAKALQVQAGIELGRRLARTSLHDRPTIRSPKDVAALLSEDMRYLQKEHFVCLFLDTKNHVIGQETLSMGSLNASVVHPREVFRAAIRKSSASIICAHNHPSGDPAPSPEDIDITRRLEEAGKIIGIELLDHVIIGDSQYVSLKEKGYL